MVKIKNILLSASLVINIMLVFLWFFESGIQQLPPWIKVVGRLHPMVLHFPIALLLIIALLELVNSGAERPNRHDSNFTIDFLLAITAFTSALAAICGFFLLY